MKARWSDARLLAAVGWSGGGDLAKDHPAGWLERPTPSELRIRLLPIAAGRTARTLVEDELLDVVLSRDHPPVVRLTEVLD
jgi:hypothetical protein